MKAIRPKDRSLDFLVAPGLARTIHNVRRYSDGRWFAPKAGWLLVVFLATVSTIVCAAILLWYK